ncbi:MAG: hypothetical protein LBN27_08600 [Prevotellaceae bacterium]|jgi:hypothetical protein|nr:hypothetical protein [Prevotellaceae bacterium]
MKKVFMIILSAALTAVMFSSCGKDDKNDNKPTDYSEYEYSKLTPEQQKEKLASDAKATIEKLNGLSNASGIELLLSFNALSEISPLFGEDEESEFAPAAKSAKAAEALEDIVYIKDFYGKFTWNAAAQKWEQEESADKLIIVLPAKRGGTANNGQIEITGESSGNFAEDVELPKSLKASLVIDGKSVGSIEVKGENVNDASAPKSASVKLTVDDYSIEYAFAKGSKNTTSLSFKKGSETLLSGAIDLTGDLDKFVEDEDVANFENGNYELKVNDKIAYAGKVDLKSLSAELQKIVEKYNNLPNTDANRKAILDEENAAMNQYMKIYLISLSDKTKIAEVHFDVIEEQGEYWNGEEYVTGTYYNSVENLVFGDGTKVAIDVYFGEGFDTVTKAWEDFISKFEK